LRPERRLSRSVSVSACRPPALRRINIRKSAILGLVGAGGIGTALETALSLLYWDQVAVVLLTIFVVVIAAELVVTTVRSRIL
jgi:phosphonate transport system permease protein